MIKWLMLIEEDTVLVLSPVERDVLKAILTQWVLYKMKKETAVTVPILKRLSNDI